MTVVPAARCAPSRTRSASAMRTPVGQHVVDHPRELVDAEHLHRPVPAQRQRGCVSKSSTAHGPCVRPDDVGQHAEHAVEVELARRAPAGARAGAAAGRRRRSAAGGASRSISQSTTSSAHAARRRAARRRRRARSARAAGSAPCRRRPSAGAGYQVSSVRPSAVDRREAVAPGRCVSTAQTVVIGRVTEPVLGSAYMLDLSRGRRRRSPRRWSTSRRCPATRRSSPTSSRARCARCPALRGRARRQRRAGPHRPRPRAAGRARRAPRHRADRRQRAVPARRTACCTAAAPRT